MNKTTEPVLSKFLFNLLFRIFKKISFNLVNTIGKQVGRALFLFFKKRKNIAFSNLKIAFPEKSNKQLTAILKQFCQNISKDIFEAFKYNKCPPDIIKKRVIIVGAEHIERASKKNKGVILLSAHFGFFPLIIRRFVVQGYQVAVIYRNLHNKIIGALLTMLITKNGIMPILDKPRHRCVAESLGWLKKGRLLFLQIDQNPSRKAGVPVDFFGHKIPTFRGAVILAMRTGATIVPVFIIRDKNNHHRIMVEKPYKIKRTGNDEYDIKDNLESLSKITENYIRRHPQFWWWIHRRFRKRVYPNVA